MEKMKFSKSIVFWNKVGEFFFSATCFALTTFYAQELMSALNPLDSDRLWFIKLSILAVASAGSTFLILLPILIGCFIHGGKVYDRNIAITLLTVGQCVVYAVGGILILSAVAPIQNNGGYIATGVMYLSTCLLYLFDVIMSFCCGLMK